MKKNILLLAVLIASVIDSNAQYFQWVNSYSNNKNYYTSGLGSDHSGNVFMSSVSAPGMVSRHVELKKINASGSQIWGIRIPYNNEAEIGISNVAIDYSGNSYIAVTKFNFAGAGGTFIDATTFVNYQYFLVKYSPTGQILRVDSLASGVNLICDSIGSLYLTNGIGTKKINSNGNPLWNNLNKGGSKIGLDGQNNVYVLRPDSIYKLNSVTGNKVWGKKYGGNDLFVHKNGTVYIAANDSIFKLSSSGNKNWSRTNYKGTAITVDASNNIFLCDGSTIFKLNGDATAIKWSLATGNASADFITVYPPNCYVGGAYTTINNETVICPFHFPKSPNMAPAPSSNSYLTKINQNGVIPFQANIYTPTIPNNYLCTGKPITIPYNVCTNSNSTFDPANEFRAELSNRFGNFDSNVVDIGLASSAIIPGTIEKGSLYHVRVVSTNPVVIGDANSNGAFNNNLQINPIVAKITNVSPVNLCVGDSVVLYAEVNDSLNHFNWYNNFNSIPGGYNAIVDTSGSYYLNVFDPSYNCYLRSDTVYVNLKNPPNAQIINSGPLSFCNGDSVILTANSATSYQWKRNNSNINGATLQNYTAKIAGNYKVKLTNAFGCTDISNIKSVTVPCKDGNPNEIIKSIFSAYPNPFSGSFGLSFSNDQYEQVEVNIYDLTGRICENYTINFKQKDIPFGSELDKGVYLIEVVSGDHSQRMKIIKD